MSVLSSLIPVFTLIMLGFFLRTFFFRGEEFWKPLEKITYYVLFPALLISTIAETHIDWPLLMPVLAVTTASILTIAVLLLVLRPRIPTDGPGFSSIFQGSIRYNTFVGLSAAAPLYGNEGIAQLAVIVAFMVPLVNVLSVYVLSRYASQTPFSVAKVLSEILVNPLVLSSVAGIILSIASLPVPGFLAPTLAALNRASLPIGLITVGAGLNMAAVSEGKIPIGIGNAVKLLFFPLLVWAGCTLADVPNPTLSVAVLFASLPTASSAYILARFLGGDHELMAGIITSQTLMAFLTLPLTLVIFR